jgi:leucyl aminopeptidase
LKSKSVKKIAFGIDPDYATRDHVSAVVEGAVLSDFEPDRYKTGNDKKSVDEFLVAVWGGNRTDQEHSELEGGVSRGRILGEAQNFARSLVNEPGNLLTPAKMADAARQMAATYQLDCEVLEQGEMAELGMRALLGVSQGSAEPPAFIVLRYKPAKAESASHLGLVGKGVTFDTGGISIKPADSMEKMKYDMAGGAAMIGAMRAIAQLRPALAVTAFIPCVENMPGSRAVGKDHRGDQYRCRRAPDPGRCADLRAPPRLYPSGGCSDPDRGDLGGAGPLERGPFRQRRRHARPGAPRG